MVCNTNPQYISEKYGGKGYIYPFILKYRRRVGKTAGFKRICWVGTMLLGGRVLTLPAATTAAAATINSTAPINRYTVAPTAVNYHVREYCFCSACVKGGPSS